MLALLLVSIALAGDVVPTDDGASVREVRWARPFTVARPEPYRMTREDPPLDRGVLLELRVDPAFVAPIQGEAPVLYVGETPARALNWDPVGGCLVAFVIGAPDLTTTPVYFGSTELPERVDAARGRAELEAARAIGVKPLASSMVADALTAGGAPLAAVDMREVYAAAADRIEACSPREADRARNMR